MSSITRVLLILGAGSNIGASLASKFAANGYKVATVSRKSSSDIGNLHISADLGNTESIKNIFSKVKQELGVPNVVVFNASPTVLAPKDDPLSLPVSGLESCFAVNVKGLLVAANEAKQGFEKLSETAPGTFIYTGNILNLRPLPGFVGPGASKAAAAHIIAAAAQAYQGNGGKFYYADERFEDGEPVYSKIGGNAAAEHYFELSEKPQQGPWLSTFVDKHGYKDFGPYKL